MAMTLAFLFPGQGRIPDRPSANTPLSETLFHLAESRGLTLRQWMSDGDVERISLIVTVPLPKNSSVARRSFNSAIS